MGKGAASRKSTWATVRDWHLWLGLAVTLFVVTTALTGIYHNHKPFFERLLGSGPGEPAMETMTELEAARAPLLTTSDDGEALGRDFARALAVAAERLGAEVPLKKIELNVEHGRREFRIHTHDHTGGRRELFWDADTGALSERSKDGYERTVLQADGTRDVETDWGKLLIDIHTGKIVESAGGRFVIDVTALILVTLAMTGVYLWLSAKLRKRRSKARSRSPMASVPPVPPTPPRVGARTTSSWHSPSD